MIRFGYIDFEGSEAAQRALNLNGVEFNGRKLYVDLDEGKGSGNGGFSPEGPRKTIRKNKDSKNYSDVYSGMNRVAGPTHYHQEIYQPNDYIIRSGGGNLLDPRIQYNN